MSYRSYFAYKVATHFQKILNLIPSARFKLTRHIILDTLFHLTSFLIKLSVSADNITEQEKANYSEVFDFDNDFTKSTPMR